MILSNVEVQAALDPRLLVIRPIPQPLRPGSERKCPYDTHSVNLALSPELSIPVSGPYSFDLAKSDDLSTFLSRISEKVTIDPAGYPLKRMQFVLGKTVEYVNLPLEHPENETTNSCPAARIEGRSSVARCGVLVHFTAPTVHPGFDGTLTLEIINMGPADFILRPNMPIAQLIVETVAGIPFVNPSQFKGQDTPEGGRG